MSAPFEHRAFSIPNPTSDHQTVVVTNRAKEKSVDPDPPPFLFRSTGMLADKQVSLELATIVATENTLVGRREEFEDPENPNFFQLIDDFFLNAVQFIFS